MGEIKIISSAVLNLVLAIQLLSLMTFLMRLDNDATFSMSSHLAEIRSIDQFQPMSTTDLLFLRNLSGTCF